jgi:hypothetical protein
VVLREIEHAARADWGVFSDAVMAVTVRPPPS